MEMLNNPYYGNRNNLSKMEGKTMVAEEITRILRIYIRDNGKTLEQLHGSRAVQIARDMEGVLRYRLHDEAPFDSLWNDFTSDPQGVEPELTGALETLMEAYPYLKQRLEELSDDYSQIISSTALAEDSKAARIESRSSSTLNVESEKDQQASGTYLYGNVPGGRESEGRKIGVEESDFGLHGRLERDLTHATDIPGIFQRLNLAVREHPEINDTRKMDLESHLRKIQDLLSKGNKITQLEQDQIINHMENVRRLSPDIFEILILALRKDKSELSGQARDAIERV
jgi:hypothetical protein